MALKLETMGLGELRELAAATALERARVESEEGGHDLELRAREWDIQRMIIAKTPPMAGAPGAAWYWREG